ncbi:carbohydrate ABC transporter permease [Cohnella xylanilytica]|uniref:Carbohydrate ABC transporter permease n=1 Tax=Cohnella xylanilytica TaxID=557555 RepID=A0A841U2V0_9BACL|nr:carbohydrate ABC transporter permease [Cohnella xylanilytica]MBB6694865.1 carbohydrate ABC transporter permease [Cohnella xylanilytica]
MNLRASFLFHRLFVYLLLVCGGVVFMIPFVWMLSTSLKGSAGLFDIPPKWIPEPVQWRNYVDAVLAFPFWNYTVNTLIITAANMAGTMISSSLVAYAFARLRWPGRGAWFVVMLATMMLPGQVTMIPMFILFKHLGWLNTFLPLTVPSFFGSAIYIFFLRQFFMTIPREFTEAAKIDGAPEFMIYWRIFLPLSGATMATIAIFTFMGTWNDFMGPLIYLNDPDKFTLALGLRSFQQAFGTRWNVMMACSIIVMLPSLILFFTCQRYFIEGITLTGIKG